jgi:hypothetical protein
MYRNHRHGHPPTITVGRLDSGFLVHAKNTGGQAEFLILDAGFLLFSLRLGGFA